MIFRLSDFSIAPAAQCSRRNLPKATADFTDIIVAQENTGLAQKYIQESELQKQIIEKSQTIALPADWSKEMLEKLEREEKQQAQSADAFAEANRKKIFALQEKLDKLLEGYLDNLIDEDTYKRKKENLVQQKIALKGEQDRFCESG